MKAKPLRARSSAEVRAALAAELKKTGKRK
jgi:hypothetical protein